MKDPISKRIQRQSEAGGGVEIVRRAAGAERRFQTHRLQGPGVAAQDALSRAPVELVRAPFGLAACHIPHAEDGLVGELSSAPRLVYLQIRHRAVTQRQSRRLRPEDLAPGVSTSV